MSKRIHCKGCGRWLFEVDDGGEVVRARPRAGELTLYQQPRPDQMTDGWFLTSRHVIRCTNCGTMRDWDTQIPLGP